MATKEAIGTIKMPDTARVWIYQSNRVLNDLEVLQINEKVQAFTSEWASHSIQLASSGAVLYQRFIVLMVDEHITGASGCSIDSSVRFIKTIEQAFDIQLFDRMIFSFIQNDEVKTVDRNTFASLYQQGNINDQTLVFDTLVNTKGALQHSFIKPLGSSWHKRMV